MSKLDPELFQKIRSICEHAGNLVQMGEDEFAISKYYEALILVPDPKSDHSISTFIYTALGEEYFSMKDYAEAGKCFYKAYNCPGGEDIGQISFRIGQCLEECGERRKAQDFLCHAYLLDGDAPFLKANPKYYKIIRSEVEGTLPEDDELDLLREDDDTDLIDNILRKSSARDSDGDYSGYSGGSADRELDLYKRPRAGDASHQQRTMYDDPHESEDDDYEDDFYWNSDYLGDEYDEDEVAVTVRPGEKYDAPVVSGSDRSFMSAERELSVTGDDAMTGEEDDDDKGEGVWAKITGAVRKFIDLFK